MTGWGAWHCLLTGRRVEMARKCACFLTREFPVRYTPLTFDRTGTAIPST